MVKPNHCGWSPDHSPLLEMVSGDRGWLPMGLCRCVCVACWVCGRGFVAPSPQSLHAPLSPSAGGAKGEADVAAVELRLQSPGSALTASASRIRDAPSLSSRSRSSQH